MQPKATQEIAIDSWVGMGYLCSMTTIAIDSKNPNHAKTVEVLESLRPKYGSAANAAVQCLLESPLYQAAATELERQQNSTPHGGGDKNET